MSSFNSNRKNALDHSTASLVLLSVFMLSGCQHMIQHKADTTPLPSIEISPSPTPPAVQPPPPSSVVREPLPEKAEIPPISASPSIPSRPHINVPTIPKPKPPRLILPSQPPVSTRLKDGRNIPAYQQLMRDYIGYLRQNNLVAAESMLTRVQRIAPQSADVYRELARMGNLKGQSSAAEAFARKGLMYAQSNIQRKQLWEQILISAERRHDTILQQQAKNNMTQF